MATTSADLAARVRGLESRTLGAEEDITETRNDVRWLKRGLQALLDQSGISIDEIPEPDGVDDSL